ncbi:hypothetical protein IFM89_004617 [Coptis chinensis]|uniref:Glutamine amidotransferase type-2 domain-containing protein n=1 Tax=Coptis chinensis TaxID=261450 RepID=A0A835LDJ9_9MAGN|nr:hypothetical protein IFM89_004617 [Coptis chinensis]
MCGIAIVVSGVRFELSSFLPDYKPPPPLHSQPVHYPKVTVEDIKAVLERRGPDNLGTRKVYPQKNDDPVAELYFVGATLQLTGITPVFQPLVDTCSNVLVYNGEIFGGLHISKDSNDSETLMHSLGKCCPCNCHGHIIECQCIEDGQISVIELLSTIKGPWALIYWQDSSKTLWFGRDAFGRRSLLVHWPTWDDPRFLLSSVSPPLPVKDNSGEGQMKDLGFWEELSCGIYSVKLNETNLTGCLVGEVRKHDWADPVLNELINWERTYVERKAHEIYPHSVTVKKGHHILNPCNTNGISTKSSCTAEDGKLCAEVPASLVNGNNVHLPVSLPAHNVLVALREAVVRRAIINPIYQATVCKTIQDTPVPVAILFSGGLDSMILAALLDQCLDLCYEVDLLNVSFDEQHAPDRISARAGVKELQRISPSRRWNLVEVDADLSNLTSETKHVMSLISPSKTYMDLNIGIALWLAAGGDGWVDLGISDNCHRVKYKSDAKILLVGSGADEQCAGYSRHRTKYRLGGWLGLHEEMKLDMQRIWKRNLGRDDRCISDNGKEARFPFLDEDVIKTLLKVPLWDVADLDQPVGRGDKKILREVAQLLGLKESAFLPKRAIQFGSRIARESNRKNFGSNRAANQASAGSVVIQIPTNLSDTEAILATSQ